MDAPVVVVSDDDENIVRALERQAVRSGLWVIPDTKSECVGLVSLLRPAVVVLDLVQNRHGMDLLREIKADPRNADIEVVVVSGAADKAIQQACMLLGAAEFAEKPFDNGFFPRLAQRASMVMLRRERAKSLRQLREASAAATRVMAG